MKKILKWLWDGIKRILYFMFVPVWYVWVALILATIGWYITKWTTNDPYTSNTVAAIIGFGLLLCVILYVWVRQFYWWLTGTGDSKDGGLPKLWKRIFKK